MVNTLVSVDHKVLAPAAEFSKWDSNSVNETLVMGIVHYTAAGEHDIFQFEPATTTSFLVKLLGFSEFPPTLKWE